MKFVVQMDLDALREYLTWRLKELEEWLGEERWAGRDAGYYYRKGESQAIRDILSLIELYGASFLEKVEEVQRRRTSCKQPSYDEALDLQNADAHWLHGYNKVVNSIKGIAENQGGSDTLPARTRKVGRGG